MKKSTIKILLIDLLVIILLLLNNFVFDIFSIKEFDIALIVFINLILSVILLGKSKNKFQNKKDIIIAISVFSLLYQTIIFVFFGLKLGFLRSVYKLGLNHFLKIVLPIILVIILTEILRHQLISKARLKKSLILISMVSMIFIDCFISINLYNLSDFKGIFEFTFFLVFVSVIKNIYLTFIVYNYGYTPNIVYRFIMELPIYYLPIYPNITNYLQAVIDILLPFILFLYFMSFTAKKEVKIIKKKNKYFEAIKKVLQAFIIVLTIMFYMLMIGIFKYYFLVVGSGSMQKTLYVGDAVLVEKINKYDKLREGQVLIFNKEEKTIVHRIKELKREDDKVFIITKGDNNALEDNWVVTNEDIIGVAKFKISYLGYPTIWLNKLFGGK